MELAKARYVNVYKLMEFANNMKDKSIDANDIARFPWADVRENIHAHWIKEKCRGLVYKCSACGNYLDFSGVNAGRGNANFCPNCGAVMDERSENEETNCRYTEI